MPIFTSTNAEATRQIAADFATRITAPCIIALDGDLGAGKTTFVSGFVAALSGGDVIRVQSPTYALARTYFTSPPVHHIDLYRLSSTSEAAALGLYEYLIDDDAIILVEWPNQIGGFIPKHATWVTIRHGDDDDESTRIISVCVDGDPGSC